MADPKTEDQELAELIAAEEAARIAAEEAAAAEDANPKFVWLVSNRQDDRVVVHERDDAHPGGECFIGGSGPDYCAHTGLIDRYIREGLIIEIPEPPASRKKPLVFPAETGERGPDVPGEPIRLGRKVDPDLMTVAGAGTIKKTQARAPKKIAVHPDVVLVPEKTGTDKD